jgi:hypothetical protein
VRIKLPAAIMIIQLIFQGNVMTERTTTVLVLALLLLACPGSWADALKGQINETGKGGTGHKLGATVHANGYTLPFYSQVSLIAKPTVGDRERKIPYYPVLDKQSSAPEALLWDNWYQHLYGIILEQFDDNIDYNVAEDCRMSFDVTVTADGKVTAEILEADRTPAAELMVSAINSLSGTPAVVFPSAGARRVVWLRLLLLRHPGSYPSGQSDPIVGPDEYLWAESNLHTSKPVTAKPLLNKYFLPFTPK